MRIGGAQLASVERAARALIDAEPYRESGYVLLMEALAAQGNVAEGLRVFDRLRTLLRDELGTTPSPEAIAAHERLLHPGRASAALASETGRADDRAPGRAAGARRAPLVGRARGAEELERLGGAGGARRRPAAGPAAAAGACCSPATRGSARRSLVAELARAAHEHGAVVLAGRAPEEALAPYQPFLEALRHYVLERAARASCAATAREYGAELARLVPELRRRRPTCRRPSRASRRPSATGCSRPSSGCSTRSRPRRRSCSSSTISNGPTGRRCCCCATSRGRRSRRGF